MVFSGFWSTIPRPIIGLSPMDGSTDAAMRFITKKYGNPSVLLTEFVAAEGVRAGAVKLMDDFKYSEIERPIVAQIFGSDPDAFYKTAIVVCALGFDGIDINMGCPARKVEERGAGASLINTPDLAGKIVEQTKKGIQDWRDGISLETAGIHPDIIAYLKTTPQTDRKEIPVSIKTRIGYDKSIAEEWAKILVSFEPAAITMHGRTLAQLYSGLADWDQIGKAAKIVKQTPTLFLGNGDIKSVDEAHQKIEKYQLDGVLIGRAAMGNPWVFTHKSPTKQERLEVALEHTQKYVELLPNKPFFPIRKHLAWYASDFPNASQLRQKLVLSSSPEDVANLIHNG